MVIRITPIKRTGLPRAKKSGMEALLNPVVVIELITLKKLLLKAVQDKSVQPPCRLEAALKKQTRPAKVMARAPNFISLSPKNFLNLPVRRKVCKTKLIAPNSIRTIAIISIAIEFDGNMPFPAEVS